MKSMRFLLPLVIATALIGCGDNDHDPKPPKGNTAPTASGDSFTTQADTELSGMLKGADADGDKLTYMVDMEPTQGSLMLDEDGSFTYQPNSTVTGMDQFTFSVSDGKKSSTSATVSITIEALQVSFDTYSRAAFAQEPTDEPLPVNGREFEQDVAEDSAYDDLLQ